MNKATLVVVSAVAFCLSATAVAAPMPPVLVGCIPVKDPFGRGDCALSKGRHGQWVRGSANLLSNGHVNVRLGLETDSTFFGIGGKLTFDLLDGAGKVLASGTTSESTIPGKSPGKARIWWSKWTEVSIPPNIVPSVKNIRVKAIVLDDNGPRPWGAGGISVNMHIPMPNG